MKRILTIDKCHDCNIENCKLRTMCGLIPDECPLQKKSEVDVKPSWDNAPDWANWLTYDKDGWYWWEDMPYYDDTTEVYLPSNTDSDYVFSVADSPVPENITRAIYSRPESHKEVVI